MTATIHNRRRISTSAVAAGQPAAPLGYRLADGLARRARLFWRKLTGRPWQPPVESAFLWLCRQEVGDGLPSRFGQPVCPAATAGAVETVAGLGLPVRTQRWLDAIVALQQADGAILDPATGQPSFRATAWFLRAGLACDGGLPDDRPLRAAAACLARCLALSSKAMPARLTRIDRAHPRPGRAATAEAASHAGAELPLGLVAAPLLEAAARWQQPAWDFALREPWEAMIGHLEPDRWDEPLDVRAEWLEALLDLGRREEAAAALEPLAGSQRADGAVPALPQGGWVSVAGLARLAMCWYKLGQRERADRAMRQLYELQQPGGGLPGGWGRGCPETERGLSLWATKFFIDAVRLQSQVSFDHAWRSFPETIDPDDGRVEAVRRWAQQLPRGAAIADMGCGKGRFLRHLAAWDATARLVGVDAARPMLASLPHCAAPCQGSLLRLPLPDESFDGVLAVESLEHALLPQVATAELCRILRPGGRVLVIDKDRKRQPLSRHEPWEQWLSPSHLTDWLGHWCDQISVAHVCHLEGRGRPLFFAISAVKRR